MGVNNIKVQENLLLLFALLFRHKVLILEGGMRAKYTESSIRECAHKKI